MWQFNQRLPAATFSFEKVSSRSEQFWPLVKGVCYHRISCLPTYVTSSLSLWTACLPHFPAVPQSQGQSCAIDLTSTHQTSSQQYPMWHSCCRGDCPSGLLHALPSSFPSGHVSTIILSPWCDHFTITHISDINSQPVDPELLEQLMIGTSVD